MYLPSGEKDGEPSKPLDALVRRLALPVSSATLYKNEDVACERERRTDSPSGENAKFPIAPLWRNQHFVRRPVRKSLRSSRKELIFLPLSFGQYRQVALRLGHRAMKREATRRQGHLWRSFSEVLFRKIYGTPSCA